MGVGQRRLKAEWEEQCAILMSFPHARSDWSQCLEEARACFIHIIECILGFESVLLCVDTQDSEGQKILLQHFGARARLWQEGITRAEIKSRRELFILSVAVNDTWARDFGAISIEEAGEGKLLDFVFNGWGLKFAANFDNQITQSVLSRLYPHIERVGLVLEGGSIESNGNGALLTNTQCLLEPNRNPHLSQAQIESKLRECFGLELVHWLTQGYLAGDDTDSHIDTLARFIAPDTIAYIACDDEGDEHYSALRAMEEELRALKQANGEGYKLVRLPFTRAIYDEAGQRLPASYANFLFVNGALLVPTYEDSNDEVALAILREALPKIQVLGVPCSTLIVWHGSLHCVTMQLY